MKPTSQHAITMVSRNEKLAAGRQLLIDEFVVSKRLLVLVLGAVLLICGLLYNSNIMTQLLKMPIEYVEVQGELRFVDKRNLQSVLASYIREGYLESSLRKIKIDVETLPWIDTVRLQRVWPNKLSVDVIEQKPAAVWLDYGLINERGELFVPNNFAEINTSLLPKITGPEKSEQQTWQRYITLKKVFSEYNLDLRQLVLDEKGGQKIILNNGIHVLLGSQDLEQRLSRFFKVYRSYLSGQRNNVKRVDLRYTNGIAVTWLDQERYLLAGINEE